MSAEWYDLVMDDIATCSVNASILILCKERLGEIGVPTPGMSVPEEKGLPFSRP